MTNPFTTFADIEPEILRNVLFKISLQYKQVIAPEVIFRIKSEPLQTFAQKRSKKAHNVFCRR